MNNLKLGSQAKDIITGFQGVIIAHASYLTGCDQYCLKPTKLSKEGKPLDGIWFDVEQIEPVNAKAVEIIPRETGGPQSDAPAL